jgi:monovalent cation:H+ antiporter, CPA1 family
MPLSETILILMILLAIGMIMAGIFRKLPIPYTVLLVCIGIVLSELSDYWLFLEPLKDFQLTPDLVLFIFLPTLIFESGLNLNARQLIKDIGPVLALAVPALLFSTFLIGTGMWLLLSVDFTIALIFGALISATDPVAVISLFKELGTPERLTTLVEGESLLNDATAIVLFNILLGIALYGGFSWTDSGSAIGEFIKVFIGGVLVGILLGFIVSWISSKLPMSSSAILVLSLVLAYSSFIIAEHGLHLSGVMAVVGASVTFGVFGIPTIAKETGHALEEIWEFLTLICNTLLFLLVGLSVSFSALYNHLYEISIAIILVLLARASMIYSLVPATTRIFRLPIITIGEQHIMWWGGLKGGLAIAIVLSIPDSMPEKEFLLTLTLGVVMFTLLVNAPSIRPLIQYFKLDKLSESEDLELKQSLEKANIIVDKSLQKLINSGILSYQGRQQIKTNIEQLLPRKDIHLTKQQQQQQYKLNAMQIEQETLNKLYKAKVISGYVYVDLRSEFMRAREHIHHPDRIVKNDLGRQQNPFIRLEYNLIKRLREKDWAISFLSYYQNMRLSQHLSKNLAQILITESAKEFVENEPNIDSSVQKQLVDHYNKRLDWFHTNLATIKADFSDFYHQYEIFLSSRSALINAKHEIEEKGHQGFITAKPLHLLQRQLEQAFTSIKPATLIDGGPKAYELLQQVPLFQKLDQKVLIKLASHVHKVYFFSNDIIIGEGEHGDALYLISQGSVEISHKKTDQSEIILAQLSYGSFFGETALLGQSIRTATVKAIDSVSLLRLRQKDVLKIAEEHPEIKEHLKIANEKRQAEDANKDEF